MHVKHVPEQNQTRDLLDSRETSLADTEVSKKHIEEVLNINAAGNAPERVCRPSLVLGPQFGWQVRRLDSRCQALQTLRKIDTAPFARR